MLGSVTFAGKNVPAFGFTHEKLYKKLSFCCQNRKLFFCLVNC